MFEVGSIGVLAGAIAGGIFFFIVVVYFIYTKCIKSKRKTGYNGSGFDSGASSAVDSGASSAIDSGSSSEVCQAFG